MASTEVGFPVNCHQADIVRPVANFSPSLWGDRFSSFSLDSQVSEMYMKEIQVLKEEVRRMLLATASSNHAEKMNLVDTLQRLGVSYHFEKEIKEQLEQVFNDIHNSEESDLFTVALNFRLLRQHGYNMSCSVFNKFKDSNGRFKESLTSDVRGMLGLYEAAHLRIQGEDILDEALAFTTAHLGSMENHLTTPVLAKQVARAMVQHLQKGYPRIEAKHYISLYQEDESKNESLLRLAKLDFNLLQMLHKQELCELSRWWKGLDITSKLPFVRDRLVECYFWAAGVYFEPQYSLARIMLVKTIAMISIIDDIYDAYGTVEELQVFTDAVQRWDISVIDQLPDYMKICYRDLLKLYDEYYEVLAKQGRSYAVYFAKDAMKEVVRNYYTEAKWFIEGYLPQFEEYMSTSLITSTYYLLTTSSFLGMKEAATKEAFDWLINKPKIVVASMTVCRLIDDIATYEVEKERGQVATGIECYMKQHGVSKQEAMDEFHRRAENAWKDMNEECLEPTSISMDLLMRPVNLARLVDVTYKGFEDGYTHPERVLKDHIIALFVDPLLI